MTDTVWDFKKVTFPYSGEILGRVKGVNYKHGTVSLIIGPVSSVQALSHV